MGVQGLPYRLCFGTAGDSAIDGQAATGITGTRLEIGGPAQKLLATSRTVGLLIAAVK